MGYNSASDACVANGRPPGWAYNPSALAHRLPLLALAVVGCSVAIYLACYQLNIVPSVWDPIFGQTSSSAVLKSSFSRSLPVPDALAGAFLYLCECALDLMGDLERWRSMPWTVLLFGAMAAAMSLGGVGLAALQTFYLHAGCTLCLLSALISIVLAIGAAPEVFAALQYVIHRYQGGASVRDVLLGRDTCTDAGQRPAA